MGGREGRGGEGAREAALRSMAASLRDRAAQAAAAKEVIEGWIRCEAEP